MNESASARGTGLHPLGTARQRLEPSPALPPAVAQALLDADAGEAATYLTWQIGAWAPELSSADRARFQAIVAASLIAVGEGSTRVAVNAGERRLLGQVPHLVGGPGERKPFILEGGFLHHHKHFASETRIVEAIRWRRARPLGYPALDIAAAVAEVAATVSPRLTEAQQRALEAVIGRSLGVVSGGPGTGKTTIVLALVRALVRLGIPAAAIGLAAPTGKAAGRLDEAIERAALGGSASVAAATAALPAAQTLHRLLGYSPSARAFAHHEQSPLPQQAVIVDEASMIDLSLMDALLRAAGPATVVVLIGDADQLPSVDAGAVFRDLAIQAVRLDQSHRLDPARPQARQILELARQVRAGSIDAVATLPARSVAELRFDGPEPVAAEEREALLERWYTELVAAPAPGAAGALDLGDATFSVAATGFAAADEARLEALFAHHQRCRLLAVTRGRPTGADALNAWMHARAGATGPRPIAGEPVMILKNDYDRGLWNGDQGVVIDLHEPHRPPRTAAAFKVRGRWTAHSLDSLRDGLTLAFALTVHKAQGSEYDRVALVLPEVPIPLASRELVYTALTRSRQAVVVCGAAGVLAAAIAETGARSSGIADKLAPSVA
jgi:exodeoxyribonuclease V alpha subunit